MSLDYLALKTGINVSTLSRMERRLITGTQDQRELVAKFFKVPAENILSAPAVAA